MAQQPLPQQYSSVPQTSEPVFLTAMPANIRSPSSRPSRATAQLGSITQGVASGAIGGAYGPYSSSNTVKSINSRFLATHSQVSSSTKPAATTTVPPHVWEDDPDLDDTLHNSSQDDDDSFTIYSLRGWLNAGALVIIAVGLIILFAGYPIIAYYSKNTPSVSGYNLGGINSSGQIPDLPGLPSLIDEDTPTSAYSRTGQDGLKYNLVFSDEFNTDGRTFYPGDDPFWEAADLHYWTTDDLEWYDPSAITTVDGKLVITFSMEDIHDLNFKSGMLTTWNKLCFTTGYIEVSISMPGDYKTPGFWPGAWTMGNLGRPAYGATTDGMWPYSYDACDVGTFPNQTTAAGEPAAALTGSSYGGSLSYLPGQRTSACTCEGGDHPGPSINIGRGAPEIDIFEHQIDVNVWQGMVSQTFQLGPFNYQYQFDNTTPATTVTDSSITHFNTYIGNTYQQSVSALTYIDETYYNDEAYGTYGIEWFSDPESRDDGYIQWYSGGVESWKITSASVGPDDTVEISQRLIPEEPMYLIFNLGMADNFQPVDFKHITFPGKMYIDYVRVYQRVGTKNGVTCNPPLRPTQDYINAHIEAYTNPNLTTWEQTGFPVPSNSLYDGC
ncbi:glycoside hydrolase family 16 protein [Armillaria fumosa]|nr:glycoside hydrolase family 16 protein [Armillaria fumosa]